ncbi:MAG TPA: metal-dependent hydrolase [Solirubrobacterales bacterium]|nr:metal-dependent hydrolase [Solirubrobacterales bacterium]
MRRTDPKLAFALIAAIVALDGLWELLVGPTGPLTYGLVDEPAHLATCVVLLLALAAAAGGRLPLPFVGAALIATVAIDLDHVPGLLGSHLITGALPRPYTHSIASIAVLLALAAVLKRGGQRQVALGLAFGISAHLLRDVATGPGVPLLWPLSEDVARMPYAIYPAALALASLGAALRMRPRPVRRRRSPLGARPLPSAGLRGDS